MLLRKQAQGLRPRRQHATTEASTKSEAKESQAERLRLRRQAKGSRLRRQHATTEASTKSEAKEASMLLRRQAQRSRG